MKPEICESSETGAWSRSFRQQMGLLRGLFGLPLILSLNGFVNFLSMDGDFGRGFDPQANFIATNVDDGDLDIVTDKNAFVALS